MDNQYPNSGILFRNDKKQEGTKQPDHTGELNITCGPCGQSFTRKLAGWVRESRTGRKFFALSFKPAEQQDTARPHSTGGSRPNAQDLAQGTDIDAAFGKADDGGIA